MSKVISIFNQKGGVGKTTTNVNLCAALALKGKKVLSIDIDPQGNSTSGFGIEKNSLEYTIYDGNSLRMSVVSALPSFDFVPLSFIPIRS
jgi:chromosome partitioning protein